MEELKEVAPASSRRPRIEMVSFVRYRLNARYKRGRYPPRRVVMRRTSLGCLLLLLAVDAGVSEAQEVSSDTKARFQKALEKLGSDEFAVREEGSKEIASLPSEALRLVQGTLAQPGLELEIRTRLESAATRLKAKSRIESAAQKKISDHAWTRKTIMGGYENSGQKDPRWDAQAKEALEAIVPVWAELRSPDRGLAVKAYALSEAALQAGCTEPMVLYAHARMYDSVIRKDFKESVRLHVEAARAMRDRGKHAHPLRQAYPFARAAEFLGRSKKDLAEADRKEIQEWLDLSLARFGDAAKDPEVPEYLLVDCGDGLTAGWNVLTRDRKIGFVKATEVLSKARPNSTVPLLLKGTVFTHYAWDARGSGTADTVKEDGWKLMAERLAEAEMALTQAWEKRPGDSQAPTQMLAVELGQEKGRAVMETW